MTGVAGHAGRAADDMTFGMELVMDIDRCQRLAISSRSELEAFSCGMVAAIDMRAYGKPILEHFGHDDPVTSGWTLVQLIETSSITAHFSEALRRAHLNVFSCRRFDVDAAIGYAVGFLGLPDATVTHTVLYR